jgi:hypothetical protein
LSLLLRKGELLPTDALSFGRASLPDDARDFLENEAKETGVPLSNLMSYIAVNYVREEKKKRAM